MYKSLYKYYGIFILLLALVLGFLGCEKDSGMIEPVGPQMSVENDIEPIEVFISDMRNNGISEEEIAIEVDKYLDDQLAQDGYANIPTIEYPLKQYPGSLSKTTGTIQNDGRIAIEDEDYRGIKGTIRPGSMDIHSGNTETIYATSHIGYGGSNWVEVGVARWISNGQPTDYWVYTYVSGTAKYTDGTQGWKWIKTLTKSQACSYHTYKIYVSSSYSSGGYSGYLQWDGSTVANFKIGQKYNNPDANFETFTKSWSYSTKTETSNIFKEMKIYKSGWKKWGTGGISDEVHWGHSPVSQTFTSVDYYKVENKVLKKYVIW